MNQLASDRQCDNEGMEGGRQGASHVKEYINVVSDKKMLQRHLHTLTRFPWKPGRPVANPPQHSGSIMWQGVCRG